MKKRIGITELLRWTYRDELPKLWNSESGPAQYVSGWSAIERYGELMTEICAPRNRYGIVIDFTDFGRPHQDAMTVADAVAALDDYGLSIPDDWYPLDDFTGLGEHGVAAVRRAVDVMTVTDAEGRRVLRKPVSHLMLHRAVMASPPEWQGEQPEVKPMRENGAIKWYRRIYIPMTGDGFGGYEVEVDGFDRKRRHPYPDAYRKFYLDPDPQEAIIGRGEYELWRNALDVLVDNLGDTLEKWTVERTALPLRPWLDGMPGKRILPDMRGLLSMTLGRA